ncbi:filamentous hemagglutinin [Variovorax paradoxus]|uniref:two-partner secretion domain-containing protein n=1 Tax=Variovorax atrisoli TaxID=3394203 RepID=UPI0028551EAF|nr:filamentous hemagglutinin N-terminal domain-containing protein [Variovorax paradoxus]MDR6518870.1 filamentous hemagglutinin [Variovorax paradoxus]
MHRVVFNAARGMRMVVQETAASTGKGASRATTAAGAAALAGVLIAGAAHAQIVGAPNVPGNLRPTVLMAPNGVPLVNIQTPSAAGVSRNVYNQFSVGSNGAILNNSRVNVQTQLGGFVQGNPNLATGTARIILNEVNGGTPSQLRGYIEVGGQRAEVIIANPAGISVDGGGFINASRATLTTGTPQFNAVGGLDSFLVRGGTITIDGAGLDASKTDYAAILARAVQANASIWASELKVVTGANQISADHSQITPTTGTGTAPTFALDVAALGGMYANKIVLIGSEAGLGVRNAGSIGAGAGGLVVTAAGRLENIGTLEGQRVELTTPGDIVNRGGTIRQGSLAGLTIASPILSNTNGGVIGAEPVSAGASGGGAATPPTSTPSSGGGTATPSTTEASGTSTGGSSTPATYTPPAPGLIAAGGTISNDGGKIYAGGPITLNTPQVNNAGGSLNVATMAVAGPSFSNAGGTLNVSQSFGANVGSFDNTGGKLNAGSLDITTSGNLVNVDGALTSASDTNLAVGGNADNTRGAISAAGALTASVAGAIQNTAGTLASNQNLSVTGRSLNNSQGNISSAGSNIQLNVDQQLLNTGGHIASSGTLAIQTGSLDGTGGNLQSTGDMSVAATQALTSTGTNVAGGNATFKGASVDLAGSQTGATNISIEATQGDVATSGATVATPGTLAITANAQPGQTLVNSAGQLNAAQLQINVSNIANTNSGEIIQTGTGATVLAVSGSIDNSNSHIATNGQDLTLQATSITNTSGKIDHAGSGTLSIVGGGFDGASGKITSNGALAVNLTGAFNQDKGTTYAKQVDITAGSLSNQNGGSIVQADTGTTTLNIGGALANNGGTIASNGAITANAGSLANRGGKLQAAGSSDLNLAVTNFLDNSAAGQILAGGNATVQAGSLKNDAGTLTAVGDLKATVSGAVTNVGGTLASNGNTTVTAASLDNSAGTTAAVNGNLSVTTTGQTTNTGGTLQAGGTTTLSNGGLSSAGGKVFGNSLSIDTHGGALDNSAKGTVAATTTVDIKSGALSNDTGLVQSGGAMAIDTNGQALTNTNATGYTSGQGGITSADTLTLNAGAVNNSAGFIGAKGVLTANTQHLSNTAGGQVVGLAAVSINTNGTTYDNSGGQTQAVGALTVNAGTIQNSGGLLRSSDTTTLNASTVGNTNTSGANQGIEGSNVAINATNLGNQNGAVRAAQNLTVTGGGTIDNSSAGLLSAGDTLKLVDPNAANPSAKTLNVVNIGGTLTATNSLQIDAAKFSNDGTFASGRDMSVALTQDIVNNRDVSVSGNLTYGTTGNLTNNAKLLAGTTLTVNGNVVDNTAMGEMSGTNTVISAGTLNNRGLIDSQGNTQVNAGTLNNIGTGRLYGNAVSISAGTVLNDAETVGGTTTAATIASRGDLDIGVGNLTNREHALIFSSGNMAIGGALDANRKATGQGGTLDNLSADIQSLGNMSISMANVNNRDVHIQLGTPTSVSSVMVGVAPVTPVGSGVGRTTQYAMDEVNLDPVNGFVYRKDTGELVGMGGYGVWTNNITTVTDTAINADPAHLVAGGNMKVNGRLYNQDSQVLAGGTITANDYQSSQLTGSVSVSGLASVVNNQGQVQAVNVPLVVPPQSIALGAYKYQQNLNATSNYNAGSAAKGAGSATGGVVTGAAGGPGGGVIVEVAANVGTVVGAGGTGAGTSGGSNTGGGQTIPTVVRTSTPNLTVPQASLFRTQAGGNYLIETDPRFANYRNWLSSDYLLNSFGLDPNNMLKRLGDGFYEQKLIREQVAQLTGYRYLDGFNNDEDQYTALMNAGVTFAKQYGLRPGVALTAAQMAQLTSDIVWLVEQTVTLPDGSTQQVLVPQVYVRVLPGDIDGSGALLSANAVNITGKGNDLLNTGTIAGRKSVTIDANTVNNLGGRISGGTVAITAAGDINNIGGTIDARDRLTLEAARDINVRTTTSAGTPGNQIIDRVAGLYVTNPRGVLTASAGHDINLVGAIISNAGTGKTSFTAGNDINLGTVTTATTVTAIGKNVSGIAVNTKEVGTRLSGAGDVSLNARHDVNARAATVSAGGELNVHADNDILIESGRETSALAFTAISNRRSGLSSTRTTTNGLLQTDTTIASTFSGNTVKLEGGRDVNVVGSDVTAPGDITVKAGRNVNVVSAVDTRQADVDQTREKKMSGLGVAVNLGVAATFSGASMPGVDGKGNLSTTGANQASLFVSTERASNIKSTGGNVNVTGKEQVNVYASNLSAAGDLNLTGGSVTVMSGLNQTSAGTGSQTRTQSIAPNQMPHSLASGLNTRSNVTNRVDQTSLASATLEGRNVNITANTGDLNLIAPTINAGQGVTLSAPEGSLNFGVVNTTTEVSQSRGQRSLAYQRTADTGAHVEVANYTQINSPNLSVDAKQINVQVGQNATPVSGPNGQTSMYVPQQSLQQALAQVIGSNQPGTEWVKQLSNDRSLDGKINWEGVPVEQRQWAEHQGSLTQTGAAVVTVVASVLSWGYGAELVGAAQGSAVGAAANAGLSALASNAAVSLINNNGDIGATLRELGSSRTIKDILAAMATAGAVQGLNIGLGIQGWTTAAGASWPQVLGRNLLNGATAALVNTAIYGGSLEDRLTVALTNGLLNTAASQSADLIGNNGPTGAGNLNAFTAEIAHAIAGCLVGSGRAGAGGYGISGGSGCSAGALGAVVGHLAGNFYNPSNDPALATETILFGQMMAGIAGALIGGDQASADIAGLAGANAVENNQLGRRDAPRTIEDQQKRLSKVLSAAAEFMDSFQDVCPQCSATGFKNMNIEISSDYAGKASDGSPALAVFDPNTGKVIVYQRFFETTSIEQLGVLVHEYTHTIQGGNASIPPANSPLWSNYTKQPWEVEANRIQEAFRVRFAGAFLRNVGGLF